MSQMIDHCGVSLSKQHTTDFLLYMVHSKIGHYLQAKPS